MSRLHKYTAFLLLGVFAALATAHAEMYILAISPQLAPARRESVWREVTELIMHGLQPGERLEVYDGLAMRRVCQLALAGRQIVSPSQPAKLLLLGSALYQNASEPAFDFTDGYYPSDAHLQAPVELSPFHTQGRTGLLQQVSVYHVHSGGELPEPVYREKVARFWSLYIAAQGGTLVGFAPDAATVFARLRSGATTPFMEVQRDTRH